MLLHLTVPRGATVQAVALPINPGKDATDGIPFLSDGAGIMGSWIDQELAGCEFPDERLGKRFGRLMEQLSKGLGRTLPLACGDWASTKTDIHLGFSLAKDVGN